MQAADAGDKGIIDNALSAARAGNPDIRGRFDGQVGRAGRKLVLLQDVCGDIEILLIG